MHTLSDLIKILHRPAVVIRGLQSRFELPLLDATGYSDAYLVFLRTVIFLKIMNASDESLRDLWHLEKTLLQLLHVDSTGSPTWFLDCCGPTGHRERRLLLSNHDMGVALPTRAVQLGLNFSETLPELFGGKEMGEDALRVLNEYLKLHTPPGTPARSSGGSMVC
jgi:hypothetical protein